MVNVIETVEIADNNVRETEDSVPEKNKNQNNFSLYYRLACLNKQEIPELILGSLAAIVNGVMLPLLGIFMSKAIKAFFEPEHEMTKKSRIWAVTLVVLAAVSLLAIPLKSYFFGIAGCKLIRRIRLRCFEKIVHMEISWFDKKENSSGSISSRLCLDAAGVRSLVGDSLSMFVQNTATAVAGLIIGFGASWELALVVLFLVPLIGFNGYVQMKFVTGLSADAKV